MPMPSTEHLFAGKSIRLDAESIAYQSFLQQTSFNSTQLLRYLYLRNLREVPNTRTMVVGFEAPVISSQGS